MTVQEATGKNPFINAPAPFLSEYNLTTPDSFTMIVGICSLGAITNPVWNVQVNAQGIPDAFPSTYQSGTGNSYITGADWGTGTFWLMPVALHWTGTCFTGFCSILCDVNGQFPNTPVGAVIGDRNSYSHTQTIQNGQFVPYPRGHLFQDLSTVQHIGVGLCLYWTGQFWACGVRVTEYQVYNHRTRLNWSQMLFPAGGLMSSSLTIPVVTPAGLTPVPPWLAALYSPNGLISGPFNPPTTFSFLPPYDVVATTSYSVSGVNLTPTTLNPVQYFRLKGGWINAPVVGFIPDVQSIPAFQYGLIGQQSAPVNPNSIYELSTTIGPAIFQWPYNGSQTFYFTDGTTTYSGYAPFVPAGNTLPLGSGTINVRDTAIGLPAYIVASVQNPSGSTYLTFNQNPNPNPNNTPSASYLANWGSDNFQQYFTFNMTPSNYQLAIFALHGFDAAYSY